MWLLTADNVARFSFIHTNDLHGKLDSTRLPFLVRERGLVDYYFDSGDCIRAGNLAVPLKPEPVWGFLGSIECTASTLGNRESHVTGGAFERKLAGRVHPVVCCNLRTRSGELVFPGSIELEKDGLKIGVLGTMVAMVTERMASRQVSYFLWDDPVKSAISEAKKLRDSVDVVVALTHIGDRLDGVLAESGVVDVILGGHSHTIHEKPVKKGGVWVCQGGSHGRFLGVYEWVDGDLKGGLVPWEV